MSKKQSSPAHALHLLRRTGLVWLGTLLMVMSHAAELHIDFARTNGVTRPLHGGNNGPLNYNR